MWETRSERGRENVIYAKIFIAALNISAPLSRALLFPLNAATLLFACTYKSDKDVNFPKFRAQRGRYTCTFT